MRVGLGERQVFLNADFSLNPSDAHVYRQQNQKPPNSALKHSDRTPADTLIVLVPNEHSSCIFS